MPGGRLPETTRHVAPSRLAATAACSVASSPAVSAVPRSLRIVVSPADRSTMAMLRRVSPATGTARYGSAAASSSPVSSRPAAPPAVTTAMASWPVWRSTRATLTPLPPARAAGASTRSEAPTARPSVS
jgi:hypothetical protein